MFFLIDAAIKAVATFSGSLGFLKAFGFTAAGPAAGSYAASWMSSIATANGVGVAAGSLYSAAQSAAMRGRAAIGALGVLTVVVVVAAVVAWEIYF